MDTTCSSFATDYRDVEKDTSTDNEKAPNFKLDEDKLEEDELDEDELDKDDSEEGGSKKLSSIDVKSKHEEAIAKAVNSDLSTEEARQNFSSLFGSCFRMRGTQSYSILHTLAAGYLSDQSYEKYIPLIDLLVENDPGLPSQQDEDGKTALHLAVKHEHSKAATHLCEKVNCDPDWLGLPQKDGDTCLHIAIRKNLACAENMVKRIVAKDANAAKKILSARGVEGNTPLHIAVEYEKCRKGQDKFVQLLLNASDSALGLENNPHGSSKSGFSPLRYHQDTYSRYKTRNENKAPASSKKQAKADTTHVQRPDERNIGKKRRQDGQDAAAKTRLQRSSLPDPATAAKVEDLLLQHCLRTRPREDAIRILHGPIQRNKVPIFISQMNALP